jgi:hypothetical protein
MIYYMIGCTQNGRFRESEDTMRLVKLALLTVLVVPCAILVFLKHALLWFYNLVVSAAKAAFCLAIIAVTLCCALLIVVLV